MHEWQRTLFSEELDLLREQCNSVQGVVVDIMNVSDDEELQETANDLGDVLDSVKQHVQDVLSRIG